MKNVVVTLIFLAMCVISVAQNKVEVGDKLVIKAPKGESYKSIDFPKLNILVKRGQLASYNTVMEKVVIVDQIIESDDNTTQVILKMKDNSKFLNLFKTVKADYNKAIDLGELVAVKND